MVKCHWCITIVCNEAERNITLEFKTLDASWHLSVRDFIIYQESSSFAKLIAVTAFIKDFPLLVWHILEAIYIFRIVLHSTFEGTPVELKCNVLCTYLANFFVFTHVIDIVTLRICEVLSAKRIVMYEVAFIAKLMSTSFCTYLLCLLDFF